MGIFSQLAYFLNNYEIIVIQNICIDERKIICLTLITTYMPQGPISFVCLPISMIIVIIIPTYLYIESFIFNPFLHGGRCSLYSIVFITDIGDQILSEEKRFLNEEN